MSLDDVRLIAAAAARLERTRLAECYDSRDINSRPSPKQLELLKDIGRISVRFLIASNQCLVKGTQVATPEGPRPIECLKPGDTVFDTQGAPIHVVDIYYNGKKHVADLVNKEGEILATCTENHKFVLAPNNQIEYPGCTPAKNLFNRKVALRRWVNGRVVPTYCTWGDNARYEETYDIKVSSKANLYLLNNGLATHNSGKTSAGVREMAWILNENHPWWKRPEKWGNGPLFFIIAGQNRTNIEEEIWKRKLRPLLIDREDWKEKKSGGIVTSVRNEANGNTILFLVHGQGTDETRAALQGYRAHYVLFDEMPKEFSTFTEIQMRTDAYDGYILVAFTPLLKNLSMKNAVENAQAPYAKKYTWTIWDNPMNCTPEKKTQIDQRAASWSESERRTRMYGEWSADDQSVYFFNLESMTCELPDGYSPRWRHVESTDPATSGTTGLTIWAEHPETGVWYCVLAEYIKGDSNRAPSRTVQEVYGKTLRFNIVRRISDTMPWYIAAAREFNLNYVQPWNKTQRKDELIKNLQEALSSGMIKVCKHCTLLIEEFMTCRWKENSENSIVGSQRFHLLDGSQYFRDLWPKKEITNKAVTIDQHIMLAWEKEQKKEAAKAKAKTNTRQSILRRSKVWRR